MRKLLTVLRMCKAFEVPSIRLVQGLDQRTP